MGVRTHVGVLDDVLSLGVIAHDRACHAIEPLVVPAHDDLEEVTFAGADAGDDSLVGDLLEIPGAVLSWCQDDGLHGLCFHATPPSFLGTRTTGSPDQLRDLGWAPVLARAWEKMYREYMLSQAPLQRRAKRSAK